MDWNSAFVALLVAIIGAIGTIVGNIIVNYRGWKSSEKMIGNSKSNKTLTAMIGNDGSDRVSLSDDHVALAKEILATQEKIETIPNNMDKQQKAFADLITQNKDLLIRIDERTKNAEEVKRIREDVLTPTQFAIKVGIDNISAMADNWQKNNYELLQCKEQLQQLQADKIEKNDIINQLKKELNYLKSENAVLKNKIDEIEKGDRNIDDYMSFQEAEEGDDEQDFDMDLEL